MVTSILVVVIMHKIVNRIAVGTIIVIIIGAVVGTIVIQEIRMDVDRMIGAIVVVLCGKMKWIIFLVPLLLLPVIAITITFFVGKGTMERTVG